MPLQVRLCFLAVVLHLGGVALAASSPAPAPLSPSRPQATAEVSVPAASLIQAPSAPASLGVEPKAPLAASPIRPSSGASGAEAAEKVADPVARWLAGLGLLIAGLNFGFAIRKANRDRRFSIEDDFWFRKIITPNAIEPALEKLVELLGEMPLTSTEPSEAQAYALKVTSAFQSMRGSIQTLALYDPELPAKVIKELEECEDVLTNFAGSLTSGSAKIENVRSQVWSKMNEAVSHIRDVQVKRWRW